MFQKQRKEVINLMESHNDGDTQITEAWIGSFLQLLSLI